MKKKRARSPAQRANDKRLGALAKARAGKPRGGSKRRVTNPTRGKLDAQILAQMALGIDTASRDEIETALAEAKHASTDMARPASRRRIYKQFATMLRGELKKFGPRRNPRGKTPRPYKPPMLIVASAFGARIKYLETYSPMKWGTWTKALRFTSSGSAKFAATKSGRKAVIALETTPETEIGKALRGK